MRGTHGIPRALVTMKLTASGVTFSAAITRSPSFSRSRSSATTTMPPVAMASTAWSTSANACSVTGDQLLDVLGHHVDLDVDTRAAAQRPEGRRLRGVGDDCHLEPIVAHGGDGQAHPVECDRPLVDDIPEQLGLEREPEAVRFALGRPVGEGGLPVDVALHDVATEAV